MPSMRGDPVFQQVRGVINRRDPEGLLLADAPEDEYDSEVKDLVELVRGGNQITGESVAAVFDRWFENAGSWTSRRPDEVSEVAAELEAIRTRLRSR